MAAIDEVLRSFREIKREFYRILHKDAEAAGVTVLQLMVLRSLEQNSNISLGELSELMQLTSSTMSGVVDRLVKADLLVRDRSEQDRRAVILKLTPEGQAKLDATFGEKSTLQKNLAGILDFPEQDISTLLRILDEILVRLQSFSKEE